MKADKLKALLMMCHDKTDLPTPAMLTAGADALADSYPYSDGLDDPETIRKIWLAMLEALRQDGKPVGAASRGDSPRDPAPTDTPAEG